MIHDLTSFVRWRLKPVRWSAKALNLLADMPTRTPAWTDTPDNQLLGELRQRGFVKILRPIAIPELDLDRHSGSSKGRAFVDISSEYRDLVTSVFLDLVGDSDTTRMIMGYFDGKPWLWNIGLNYSDPSNEVTDSQMWHFDYGDTRQLHLLVYFTDVLPESGPFTFLTSELSDKVRRHPVVVERLSDAELEGSYGFDMSATVQRLVGSRGEVFAADPGRLLHQGARCATQRLVMFTTFTTRAPMSKGGRHTIDRHERKRLGEAYANRFPHGELSAFAFD